MIKIPQELMDDIQSLASKLDGLWMEMDAYLADSDDGAKDEPLIKYRTDYIEWMEQISNVTGALREIEAEL